MANEDEPIVEFSAEDYIAAIEAAHEYNDMLIRINESHKKDYDGSRRKYADQVSTASALIKRAKAGNAERNGHGGVS